MMMTKAMTMKLMTVVMMMTLNGVENHFHGTCCTDMILMMMMIKMQNWELHLLCDPLYACIESLLCISSDGYHYDYK